VLGTIGLFLATSHYALGSGSSVLQVTDLQAQPTTPASWAGPVAFLCLGLFLALVGMVLWRRDADTAESV
jgi:hypothetical protein